MLFPEKMVYLKIRIPKDKIEKELKNIGLSGLLHIDETKGKRIKAVEETRVNQLYQLTEKYLSILEIKEREKWQNEEYTLSYIEDFLAKVSFHIDKISNLKKKLEKDKVYLEKASVLERYLSKYVEIKKIAKEAKYIGILTALVSEENFESTLISFKKYTTFLLYVSVTPGTFGILLLYDKDEYKHIKNIIEKNQIDIVHLSYFLEEKKKEVAQLENQIKTLKKEIYEKYLKKLLKIHAYLHTKRKIESAKRFLEIRGKQYILYGWIPEKKVEIFKRYLKYSKIEIYPAENNAPVILKTPKIFKPFEKIIENFSYPQYREINPVVPFAISFLILFGVMFGDIGHGILLAFTGYFLRKRYKDIGQILLLSGISSIIFGFLYGSFFGFHDVIPHILFSPIKDVHKILLFSVIVGIILISVSFLLNIVSLLIRKDFKMLILGEGGFLWLVIYWYSIGIFIKAVVFQLDIKYDLILLGMFLFIYFIYLFYKSRSFSTSLIDTFREFLETITNTISFIRLGAFVLAHSALFLAVFTIAKIISTEKGEGFFYWLVIIIGNIFIVVLEGIIVTIQTLRLEFYEFFKRFYKGGGIPYRPFKINYG